MNLLSYNEFLNESTKWKEFAGSLTKTVKNGSVIINRKGNKCSLTLKYDGYTGGMMNTIDDLTEEDAIKQGEEFLKNPKGYFDKNENVNEAVSSNFISIVMLNDAAQKVKATDFSTKQKAERSWNAIKAYYEKNPYHFGPKLISYTDFYKNLYEIVKDPNPDPNNKETNIAILIQIFFTEQPELAQQYNGGKEIKLILPSEAQRRKEAAEFKKNHNVREISDNANIQPLDLEIDGYKIDSEKTWICRTKDGKGPTVIMDDIDIDVDRHLVRRFYSWTYKVNYYNVRECRAKYWIENPDKRYSTME